MEIAAPVRLIFVLRGAACCSGLYLDVSGQRMRRGAGLVAWPKTRGYNQIWRHDPISGTIQSRLNGLVVDIEGGAVEAIGARVITWTATGRRNQQFDLAPCSGHTATEEDLLAEASGLGGGSMRLTARGSGLAVGVELDGETGGVEPGARVLTLPIEGDLSGKPRLLRWRVVPLRAKSTDVLA